MDTVVIPADVSMVEQSFSYEYPNRDATKWKRKYSVSELKTLSQTTLPEEESSIMLPEQNNFEKKLDAGILKEKSLRLQQLPEERLSIRLWNYFLLDRFRRKSSFLNG